jgi:hypothetical protein
VAENKALSARKPNWEIDRGNTILANDCLKDKRKL